MDEETGLGLTPGPPLEQRNDDRDTAHRTHSIFWGMIGEMLPDDDDEEPFWMSEDATFKLRNN